MERLFVGGGGRKGHVPEEGRRIFRVRVLSGDRVQGHHHRLQPQCVQTVPGAVVQGGNLHLPQLQIQLRTGLQADGERQLELHANAVVSRLRAWPLNGM